MRLIDADAFKREMNDKVYPVLKEKYGDFEARNGMHFSFVDVMCNIDAQPTSKPDDGLERWAKVCLSILVGVIVWIVIGMTITAFREWGIL